MNHRDVDFTVVATPNPTFGVGNSELPIRSRPAQPKRRFSAWPPAEPSLELMQHSDN
jgi:hypothetical protein